MNLFKKIYCRTLLIAFYLAKPFLPYRPPQTLDGVDGVPSLLKERGKERVLLVTDKTLRALGLTAALETALREENIACFVYDDTEVNPTVANVEGALSAYKENCCQAIIAFGGGSPMDCAKIVGARVGKPKKSVNQMGGLLRVRGKIPFLVAIPTTAGTGSEATPAAVITDRESGRKYTINDFCLAPHYAVLDPKTTLTLPPHLTATTAIDAMIHALEGYIGKSSSKKTKGYTREALKLFFDNVLIAYEDGSNYEARANLLRASYLAGQAMSMAYVGYVHAVAHTIGGAYDFPHGLTAAVTLPVVLEGYGKRIHKKLYKLAVHCGIADEKDSYAVGAEKFKARLQELYEKMGIPATLKGIKRGDIPQMAKHADKEANPLYAVPVLWNAKELEPFYEKIADWREKI